MKVVIVGLYFVLRRQRRSAMENPLNNNCKPNEHYGAVEAARMLGVTKPSIYNYIKLGFIRPSLHTKKKTIRIKGSELIKYYNSIS